MNAQKKAGAALVAISAVCIAIATLTPGGGGSTTAICLFCGERGVADFVSNVLLFAPLGVGIALLTGSAINAVVAGALFSAGIEAAQIAIVHGRDANIGDVVANTAGAALGWWIGFNLQWWIARTENARTLTGCLIATLGALLGGLWLFAPALPEGPYYLQWTARFGNMHPYEGRVLSTRIGSLDLSGPPWRIASDDSVRVFLERGAPVEISLLAGPAPAGPAPIVSIGDGSGREVLFIGANGSDLVHRYRMRADDVRLDRGELRIPAALKNVTPGSDVTIRLHAGRAGYCYAIGTAHGCGSGFTVGDTWTLLLSPDLPAAARRVAQGLWLFCLFIPTGLLAASKRYALIAGAAISGVLLAGPIVLGFAPTPALQVFAAMAGLSSGWVLRAAILRVAARRTIWNRSPQPDDSLAA